MESLIEKLLGDFEDGRMSRRQLIQSLALCATAPAAVAGAAQAPAASAAGAAAGAPAPWKTVYLDHISYAVADYKKSAAFYSNLMGWKIRNDNGTNQASLDIGNVGGIIIRNSRRPAGEGAQAAPAAAAQTGQAPRPPLTGVINHISYGIEPWDTDKVKAELERRGLNPRPDMVGDNFKSFHVFDPDGWDLQISNKTSNTR
jgi:catechol 2,3-dioxygenase-like lactoylglutathione lyase family enzyme